MKIYKTTNYDKFKIIKGNRFLNQRHITNLAKALSSVNLLETHPIIVNEKMEIIDGQHRLEAAKTLGATLYYVISPGARLPEVQLLNTNVYGWILKDYLNSHIQRGKGEYELIKLFCDTYGFSVSLGLMLLSKQLAGTHAKGQLIESFKAGTFIVDNLKQAEELANLLNDYKPFFESGVYRSRDFISAIRSLYLKKLVKHSEMIRKLTFVKGKLPKQHSPKAYLRMLEDTFNYKRHNPVRFV